MIESRAKPLGLRSQFSNLLAGYSTSARSECQLEPLPYPIAEPAIKPGSSACARPLVAFCTVSKASPSESGIYVK